MAFSALTSFYPSQALACAHPVVATLAQAAEPVLAFIVIRPPWQQLVQSVHQPVSAGWSRVRCSTTLAHLNLWSMVFATVQPY
jgi:hypothetical protein